jgi:hypothetical protein
MDKNQSEEKEETLFTKYLRMEGDRNKLLMKWTQDMLLKV